MMATSWWEDLPPADEQAWEAGAGREEEMAVALTAWDGELWAAKDDGTDEPMMFSMLAAEGDGADEPVMFSMLAAEGDGADEPVMFSMLAAEGDGTDEPVMFSMLAAEDETDRAFALLEKGVARGELPDEGLVEPEIGWFEDDAFPVRTFLWLDSAAEQDEEDFVTITAFQGENLEAEYQLLDDAAEWLDGDPSAEIFRLTAMGPSPWQNPDNPVDVNADGWATPHDALLVINRVNEGVALSAWAALSTAVFADVNGDRSLDATDAVQVINTLNGGENFVADAPLADGEELADGAGASRVAPLWYVPQAEDQPQEDTWAWQPEDDLLAAGDTTTGEPEIPWTMPRRVLDDPAAEELEKSSPQEEDQLFTEDADWLLAELL